MKKIVVSLGLLAASGLVLAAAGGGGAAGDDGDGGHDQETVCDDDDVRSVGGLSTFDGALPEEISQKIIQQAISHIQKLYDSFVRYNEELKGRVQSRLSIQDKLTDYEISEDQFDRLSRRILAQIIYTKSALMQNYFGNKDKEEEDEDRQRSKEDKIPQVKELNVKYDAVTAMQDSFDNRMSSLKRGLLN